jgi:hypothetical protein
MTETTKRLDNLVKSGETYFSHASKSDLEYKRSPEKWSKKEILGHLIDSAINNLQRFTEIQSAEKPFKIRKYKQDELVIANNYQNSELQEIIQLWTALNQRIGIIMEYQTESSLDVAIELPNGQLSDLRFLMIDYVDHLEYHLKQILNDPK